jgi:ribosomal protein S18 acetylase RimI-like enzyme
VRAAVTTQEIIVREALPSDHATFTRLFVELDVDDPPFTQERFNSDMLKTTLIAMNSASGCPMGYAFYRPMTDTVHLSHLVSAPEARRLGVGRLLITEVARRSKALGIAQMKLNVKPHNTAAIALYESFGLAKKFTSRALKLEWARVDEWSEENDAPYVGDVRPIDDPNDDARIEKTVDLLAGTLADQRNRPGRALKMIERERGKIALAIFDPGFPGIYPVRAPDAAHARSLFRAIRKQEEGAKTAQLVHVMIEDQPAISAALLASGATLKLETLTMFGPI